MSDQHPPTLHSPHLLQPCSYKIVRATSSMTIQLALTILLEQMLAQVVLVGDISAEMFAQAGAQYVIMGHSERRECYGETDAHVQAKATATLRAGLTPIICIGETLAQRESGQTISVVSNQLSKSLPTQASVVIAYEPIWAIGTGIVPSLTQITEVHDALRSLLVKTYGAPGKDISILYGGSVKPKNAPDIFSLVNVNGALVGGASLKALDFVPIMQALSDS